MNALLPLDQQTARPHAGPPRTVVITQSNYLPWRGYFDMIRQADLLILLDSVQYTRRDWRNRNRIKTASGPTWITIPIEVKGLHGQSIDETRVADRSWSRTHRRAIELAYRRASAFNSVFGWFDGLMAHVADEPLLSRVNETLLGAICGRLGIHTPIRRCTDVIDRQTLCAMNPSQRLAEIASAVGAERYLTGPAARDYLDMSAFATRGIEVAWMSHADYPVYPQLWGAFEPHVSIVDLLLNCGDAAANFLGPDRGRHR